METPSPDDLRVAADVLEEKGFVEVPAWLRTQAASAEAVKRSLERLAATRRSYRITDDAPNYRITEEQQVAMGFDPPINAEHLWELLGRQVAWEDPWPRRSDLGDRVLFPPDANQAVVQHDPPGDLPLPGGTGT